MGAPISITANSPMAVTSHVTAKGRWNARCSSRAIKNIVMENTTVFTSILAQMTLIKREVAMVIKRDMADCPTPKIRSYATIGEKNKLAKKTPMIIP